MLARRVLLLSCWLALMLILSVLRLALVLAGVLLALICTLMLAAGGHPLLAWITLAAMTISTLVAWHLCEMWKADQSLVMDLARQFWSRSAEPDSDFFPKRYEDKQLGDDQKSPLKRWGPLVALSGVSVGMLISVYAVVSHMIKVASHHDYVPAAICAAYVLACGLACLWTGVVHSHATELHEFQS